MGYQVTVGGENFLIHIEGKEQRIGFHASRFIERNSREEAEREAMFRIGEELKDRVLNDFSDPPRLYIHQVQIHTARKTEEIDRARYFWRPEQGLSGNIPPHSRSEHLS